MESVFKTLLKYQGEYEGEGTNHEGRRFVGKLQVEPVLEGRGVALRFVAKGKESGELFHQEESLVAPSVDERLTLTTLSTNLPGLVTHELRRQQTESQGTEIVFGYNAPEDFTAFREEVAIDFFDNGDLGYRYSWGLPGGDFESRSGLRLTPCAARRASGTRGRIRA